MVELFMCGFVEVKRWQDFRKPGSQTEKGSFLGFESSFKPMANGYPGGIFDPLGLSRCVWGGGGGGNLHAGGGAKGVG
jgi:light-harvesting complex I chlorophyll a/b binding protein 5